jgi:hypothetical protein
MINIIGRLFELANFPLIIDPWLVVIIICHALIFITIVIIIIWSVSGVLIDVMLIGI